jgi:cytoskeletal protein CcmA (bactofilin family)
MFRNDVARLGSFLGMQSELRGDLEIHGVLRLDGSVNGRIKADQVILSESAAIQGEIAAKKIVVGGRFHGILRASEILEIRPKGKVRGEIYANNLMVLEGGEFNGRIEMRSENANILDFEPRGLEVSLKH